MGAGVHGQLGAGADGAGLALEEDLARRRVGQVGVADLDLERLNEDGLARFHRWQCAVGAWGRVVR